MDPDDAQLRQAGLMDLGRPPATPAALKLLADVWDRISPFMARPSRKAGAQMIATDRSNLGVILGGVMRPGIAGVPVSVQAGKEGVMWDSPAIGYSRVWKLITALEGAGLIKRRAGVKSQRSIWPGEFNQEGLPTRIWPLPAMLEIAAAAGLTEGTRKLDWQADALVVARPASERAAVICRALKHQRVRAPLAADVTPEAMALMKANLQALNDLLADTRITGAGTVIGLRRVFRHSLRLHGRHYTGHGTLQQFSPAERARITFNGERCAEVDVKASQITVALALAKHSTRPDGRLPRLDLYDVPGVPRGVVKAWMVRTMGNGRATWAQWGDDPPHGSEHFKPRAVWEAVKPLYPFLADLSLFVPGDLLASLPQDRHQWAGGQFIVGQEARIMAAALAYCVRLGVPALPVHDSLVVQVSKVGVAKDALAGAFMALAGVIPNLTVNPPAAL